MLSLRIVTFPIVQEDLKADSSFGCNNDISKGFILVLKKSKIYFRKAKSAKRLNHWWYFMHVSLLLTIWISLRLVRSLLIEKNHAGPYSGHLITEVDPGTLLHLRCNFMEIVIRAPESYLLLPQSTRSTVGCRNPVKFLFIFVYFKINKWIRIWDHSGTKSAINIWLRISWSL